MFLVNNKGKGSRFEQSRGKRTDLNILAKYKDLHISFEKETYIGMKMLLFEYGISMQEALRTFMTLCSNRNTKAIKIIEDAAIEKKNKYIKKLIAPKNEINSVNALYDFIESSKEDNSEPGDDD